MRRILLTFAVLVAVVGGIGYGFSIVAATPAHADGSGGAGNCGTLPRC